ncbi:MULTISPECIES: hypothetical protein [Citrobacter freundii complex]|uniref:hypothetical protein n=1 Tax=Citrobacter freundii complex TaxID=1344959 RepID=UPI0015EA859A|nr:hypothetical protein [Citrobacter freundii]MBJ9218496.1 hypothetical protein [Citrobacter freundii]QMF20789.1 hypothetical protein HVY90_03140 [Citrobacter freundii]
MREIIFCILLLVGSGCLAWFYTDPQYISKTKLPKKLRGVKKLVVIYSRYLYSGGRFRRLLFVLVVVSLFYVLFTDSSKYKFIENMAFSVIAAFIFDTFLNFQKEQLHKTMVSRFWQSSYNSCYDREKVVLALYSEGRALPMKLQLHLLHRLIFMSIIYSQNNVTKKIISLPWSSNGNGLKMIDLPKGFVFGDLLLDFIREDAKFINSFYLDEKVATSFPGINDLSRRFNNSCLIALSMIETKLGLENGWNGNDETINKQMKLYFSERKQFMKLYEKLISNYGVVGW